MKTTLVATASLIAAASLSAQQPNDSTRARIDRIFAQYSAKDGPGCSAATSLNGKTIFEAGYGASNIEADVPITPASIFHAASVSKQFTAASIMLLVHDGKLSLDDDIHKYLPELPQYGHRITIRHLLNHTSGIRDQWDLLAMARGRFEENRITETDVLDVVSRQKELNFVPDAEYLYSNSGYTLAAIIVGRVSGKPLRAFADERIFKPLGMTRTHFHDDYTMIVKGRTSAYVRRPDGQWRVGIPNFDTYGATSLYTTVGDLLKWQENFVRPVVGDAAMLEAMQKSAVLTNGDTTGYGLGIATQGDKGAVLVGHSGADAGYRAYTGRYPEHNLAVAVLCNASTSDPQSLSMRMAEVFVPSLARPVTPPTAMSPKPAAAELARVAGVYVNQTTGGATFVTVRGEDLVVGRVNGPTLIPTGPRKFWLNNTEWTFEPNGNVVQRFLGRPPRANVTLVKREAVKPTRGQLAVYAGRYTSPELGTTYVVTAQDSTLSFRTGVTDAVTETPAYQDTFLGQFTAQFTRDASGRVNGMNISTGRVRRVKFVRDR